MGVTALSTLAVRRAEPGEFDTVLDLLGESIRWLRSRGLDQWSTWHRWRDKMRPAIDRGDVWLLCDGNDMIATITVEFTADHDFWTPNEQTEPAAYVSKLAVRRERAGAELGALLLAWAGDLAFRRGCTWVRLDAWKSNEQLHQYYRDRGWDYLRTSLLEHRHSGALFQRRAASLATVDLARLRELPPPPALPSVIWRQVEPDLAGNSYPDHTHQVDALVVTYEWVGNRPATFMPWLRYRIVEHEGSWHLEYEPGRPGYWASLGPVVTAPMPLETGSTYVITHRPTQPCELTIWEAAGIDVG